MSGMEELITRFLNYLRRCVEEQTTSVRFAITFWTKDSHTKFREILDLSG